MQKKDALNMEKTALYSMIFIKYIFLSCETAYAVITSSLLVCKTLFSLLSHNLTSFVF